MSKTTTLTTISAEPLWTEAITSWKMWSKRGKLSDQRRKWTKWARQRCSSKEFPRTSKPTPKWGRKFLKLSQPGKQRNLNNLKVAFNKLLRRMIKKDGTGPNSLITGFWPNRDLSLPFLTTEYSKLPKLLRRMINKDGAGLNSFSQGQFSQRKRKQGCMKLLVMVRKGSHRFMSLEKILEGLCMLTKLLTLWDPNLAELEGEKWNLVKWTYSTQTKGKTQHQISIHQWSLVYSRSKPKKDRHRFQRFLISPETRGYLRKKWGPQISMKRPCKSKRSLTNWWKKWLRAS